VVNRTVRAGKLPPMRWVRLILTLLFMVPAQRMAMGTTALFAELVVGGLLTLTWLALTVATVLGPSRFTSITDAPAVAAGLVLAVAYALGVVFDRVWDWVLDATGLQKWLRYRPQVADTAADRQRQKVYGADPKLAVEFISYHRSRMRVARASLFNFALITVSGLAPVGGSIRWVGTIEFALVGVAGAVLCVASFVALCKLGRTHDRVLQIFGRADAPTTNERTPDA
jgi:hypothetical protein